MQLSPSPWRYNASSGYVSDAAGRVVVWTDKLADGEAVGRVPEMVGLLWALVSGEGRSTDQIIDLAAAICHQLGGAGGDVEELPQGAIPVDPRCPTCGVARSEHEPKACYQAVPEAVAR